MGFLSKLGLRAATPATQAKAETSETVTVALATSARDITDIISDAGEWLTDSVAVDDLLSFDIES